MKGTPGPEDSPGGEAEGTEAEADLSLDAAEEPHLLGEGPSNGREGGAWVSEEALRTSAQRQPRDARALTPRSLPQRLGDADHRGSRPPAQHAIILFHLLQLGVDVPSYRQDRLRESASGPRSHGPPGAEWDS